MISRKSRSTIRLAVIAASAILSTGMARAATVIGFDFENDTPATTKTGIASDIGLTTGTAGMFNTATASTPAGNGSLKSFSANGWTTSSYYEFDVTASAYGSFQFDQTGSATGPKNFQVQYEIATAPGTWVNLAAGAYSVPTTTNTSGATTIVAWQTTVSQSISTLSFDVSSIVGLEGIRLVDTSAVALNGSAVGASGTDRVDNVLFTSPAVVSAVPEPASLAVLATGATFLVGRRRRR
jgi:hypothetical protein